MKKIFTTFLFCFAALANAQNIPNGSFEEWKGSAGSSYQSSDGSLKGGSSALGLRQRPGDEPRYWEGSSVNQKVMMEKKETLVFKSEGRSGSAVKLENKYVGAFGTGSNAPGFISFATPWVYAISTVSNCDGGVYGGMQFSNRPDAIEGWFKRTGGTNENAHIIVYLWNGTFKSNIKSSQANDVKDDVDRAVMGKTSEGIQLVGRLIASCDHAFSSTNNNDWQKIVVPLNYVAGTEHFIPEKVNVIISSGDYWSRGNIQAGSVLEADDVKFVYYSELASLVYDGKNYFVNGKTSYTINAEYNASKLSLTSNGIGATIEKSFNSGTNVLTIKVKGNDYSSNTGNVHTYTVNFNAGGGGEVTPTPDPAPGGYTPAFTGAKTKTDRWINSVVLASAAYAGETANALNVDNSGGLCYNDYTSGVTMKAAAGETVTATVSIGEASWMNAYVYIDSDNNGFTASIADGSNYQPAGDLVSYSFYNNGSDSDTSGWNSVGTIFTGDSRSTVTLPAFTVPSAPGIYRVRVKLDWCNIDPAGDRDGKFGDFMDNGGQIVDFMLEVIGEEIVEPEPGPQPGDVDYTPTNTGTRNYAERDIAAVKLQSAVYGESVYELSSAEKLKEYLDVTGGNVCLVAAPAEEVSVEIVTEGSWVNHYIYIDGNADGFVASIADGSNYIPAGDMVAYSFYNNGGSSDNSGWNSVGETINGDNRSRPYVPAFAVPAEPGRYRMRIKRDWCSIDPMGDSDSNFQGTFSNYGGQIIDITLLVSAETGISNVSGNENAVKGIYDMQGRKIECITQPGIYIVDGRKVVVK
ncbi:MAG: hypothetical protein J6R07_03130 [Bacteroidaceae bacterium]|nr:hypothetical protein [Bacteroidaceae bacterium]